MKIMVLNKAATAVISLLLVVQGAVAAELKDPTRPSYYSVGDSAYLQQLQKDYRLHSVLVSDTRRLAVINGKRVREGDQVDQAIVKKISRSGVKLALPGAEFSIGLAGNNFKKLQVKK